MTQLRLRTALLGGLAAALSLEGLVRWLGEPSPPEYAIPLWFTVTRAPLLTPTWAAALWVFRNRPDGRGGRALWVASFVTGLVVSWRLLLGHVDWLALPWQPDFCASGLEMLEELLSPDGFWNIWTLERALPALAAGAIAHAASAWAVLRLCGADPSTARLALRVPLIVAACCAWAFGADWWVRFVGGHDGIEALVLVVGLKGLVVELNYLALGLRLYTAVRVTIRAVHVPQRPPWVLFLRSFGDDAARPPEKPIGGLERIIALSFFNGVPPSQVIGRLRGNLRPNFEESLAPLVEQRLGPMLALGRPDDWIPTFGATRLYAASSDWQRDLARLVAGARCVLVVPGFSEGLAWELNYLRAHFHPRRVFAVIPPLVAGAPDRIDECWWLAVKTFHAAGWMAPKDFPGFGSVIQFSKDGRAEVRTKDRDSVQQMVRELAHQVFLADSQVEPEELPAGAPAHSTRTA